MKKLANMPPALLPAAVYKNASDNFITLYIGQDEVPFLINRASLRKLELPETFEKYTSFNFPDWDPKAFDLLCEFLTKEKFPKLSHSRYPPGPPHLLSKYLSNGDFDDDYAAELLELVDPYVKLYEHAIGFGNTRVRDGIMDHLRSSDIMNIMLRFYAVVARFYGASTKGSGMRRFLEDVVFQGWQIFTGEALEYLLDDHMHYGHFELVAAFTRKLVDAKARGGEGFVDPKHRDGCFYHDHGADDQCSSAVDVKNTPKESVVEKQCSALDEWIRPPDPVTGW